MRRRRRRVPAGAYASEAELCRALAARAREEGFRVYPETSGWDLLLRCGETGDQVGVQAKLRPSVEVIAQAIRPAQRYPGPTYHAVLVPGSTPAFAEVCRELRLLLLEHDDLAPPPIDPAVARRAMGDRLWEEFGGWRPLRMAIARGARWEHPSPSWFPEVEVDVPAGVPGPRSVTPWKIAAAKLCRLVRERGHATRADFASLGLSMSWWTRGWPGHPPILARVEGSRPARYAPGGGRMPDEDMPEVVRALAAAGTP